MSDLPASVYLGTGLVGLATYGLIKKHRNRFRSAAYRQRFYWKQHIKRMLARDDFLPAKKFKGQLLCTYLDGRVYIRDGGKRFWLRTRCGFVAFTDPGRLFDHIDRAKGVRP